MPYVHHPITQISSYERTAWKYFRLKHLPTLIQNESLFFRRVIDYINDDPNEGRIANLSRIEEQTFWMWEYATNPLMTEETLRVNLQAAGSPDAFGTRHSCTMNCWTLREEENSMMWERYAGMSETSYGIAVRSSVLKIIRSLDTVPGDINISEIRYINYGIDYFGWGNTLIPIVHKDARFSEESELRLIYQYREGGNPNDWWDDMGPAGRGAMLKVDIGVLINEVVLSPNASEEQRSEVEAMCRAKGLTCPVVHSALRQV
jgi:hypothetical protein